MVNDAYELCLKLVCTCVVNCKNLFYIDDSFEQLRNKIEKYYINLKYESDLDEIYIGYKYLF
jgi:hypothetical protein